MNIGCVMETMEDETRAGIMPSNILTAVHAGHEVFIESGAGEKSGFPDTAYLSAGANISAREETWDKAEIMVKVKQPLEEEFAHFREGLVVGCFLHLAANLPLLETLRTSGVTAIDYGTIQLQDGSTPILAKMSEVAGEIAVCDGEHLLKKRKRKMLRPGTSVAIIGMGNAGVSAAKRVLPTGARLYCFDKRPEALGRAQNLFRQFSPYQVWYVQYDHNNPENQKQLAAILQHVDLLIGATHEPAKHTGRPVSEWMIKNMEWHSVAVDISIDMGGCFETSSAFFAHKKRIFKKHGVIHYCLPNMPAQVPRESTPALCHESFPYILEIANKGFKRAVRENPALRTGVNVYKGKITHQGLATSIGAEYTPLENLW